MGFWCYMLVISMLLPVTMLVVGSFFIKKTPRSINALFGYRTRRSMQNQQTWHFAHQHCGRIWLWSGIALLLISVAAMIGVIGQSVKVIGYVGAGTAVLPFLPMIFSVISTQRALKREFDEYGRRRNKNAEKNDDGA